MHIQSLEDLYKFNLLTGSINELIYVMLGTHKLGLLRKHELSDIHIVHSMQKNPQQQQKTNKTKQNNKQTTQISYT